MDSATSGRIPVIGLPSGFINVYDFVYRLNDYQLFKNDPVLLCWSLITCSCFA